MGVFFSLGPGLDHVAPLRHLARQVVERDAVLLGSGGPQRLVRRATITFGS
jgi:hypothetical protein